MKRILLVLGFLLIGGAGVYAGPMGAKSVGSAPGEAMAYIATSTGSVGTAAHNYLTLFNAVGSSVTIRVTKISISWNHTAAVTPVVSNFIIQRTTYNSITGNLTTPVLMDTYNTTLYTSVTVRTDQLTTYPVSAKQMFACSAAPEEGSAAGPYTPIVECYKYLPNGWSQPIVLHPGQGLNIRSVATLAATGRVVPMVEFTTSR